MGHNQATASPDLAQHQHQQPRRDRHPFGAVSHLGIVNLPPVPNVWDQYPGELPGDYAAFLTYLEQGSARTIANVRKNGSGYTYSYLCACAKAWLWEERAAAYDEQQLAQRRQAFTRLEAEKLERWKHDQLEISELATQVIRRELIAITERQAEGKPLSPTALTQLMDRVHKWLQISTGGATDVVGIDLSGVDADTKAVLQSDPVRAALAAIAKG